MRRPLALLCGRDRATEARATHLRHRALRPCLSRQAAVDLDALADTLSRRGTTGPTISRKQAWSAARHRDVFPGAPSAVRLDLRDTPRNCPSRPGSQRSLDFRSKTVLSPPPVCPLWPTLRLECTDGRKRASPEALDQLLEAHPEGMRR